MFLRVAFLPPAYGWLELGLIFAWFKCVAVGLGLLHPVVTQVNLGIPEDFAFVPVQDSLSGH